MITLCNAKPRYAICDFLSKVKVGIREDQRGSEPSEQLKAHMKLTPRACASKPMRELSCPSHPRYPWLLNPFCAWVKHVLARRLRLHVGFSGIAAGPGASWTVARVCSTVDVQRGTAIGNICMTGARVILLFGEVIWLRILAGLGQLRAWSCGRPGTLFLFYFWLVRFGCI